MTIYTKGGKILTRRSGLSPNCDCCDTGACCTGTACAITTAAACAGAGQVWKGAGTVCTPNPCTEYGACCDWRGQCRSTTEQECVDSGDTWLGIGVACTPNQCPPPLGGCCLPGGTCTQASESSCRAAGGTWLGPLTSCDAAACSSNCLRVKHPQTITWSVKQYPFDFRPFFLPADESLYGVPVRNGYTANGSLSLVPQFIGSGWEAYESASASTTPEYIFSPEDDPSPNGGDYLRIAPTMNATATYTRCKPGIYGFTGPHVTLSLQNPAGVWGSYGAFRSDEDFRNYNDAPSFIAVDGRKWENIADPDNGNICTQESTWRRVTLFVNEHTGAAMSCPYQDISVTVSGCAASAGNPLP